MMYLQNSFTVPAAPEKITACEACVYGRGEHAEGAPRYGINIHARISQGTTAKVAKNNVTVSGHHVSCRFGGANASIIGFFLPTHLMRRGERTTFLRRDRNDLRRRSASTHPPYNRPGQEGQSQ